MRKVKVCIHGNIENVEQAFEDLKFKFLTGDSIDDITFESIEDELSANVPYNIDD